MKNMGTIPRLSIGLAVYNGENYLAESLEALLGQSYEDFELIISDNASTDSTAGICHGYEKQDSRIRYFRQESNIGLAPNHNFVVAKGRGELFKWASHDDLYARDLLERCVQALDEYPHIMLAHSWTAAIDGSGSVTKVYAYPLATASPSAPERFRSLLFGSGGDDIYGVVRARPLGAALRQASHHHADRSVVAQVSLYGPFYQVPDWLYFRREHPEQAEFAHSTMRARCANMDPRRGNRLRHPMARLYGEYIWAYIAAIRSAPLSSADREQCYRYLARWTVRRLNEERSGPPDKPLSATQRVISVDAVVAGREKPVGREAS
jgi:glycosyltransferase involved in cell wall biosynthesis